MAEITQLTTALFDFLSSQDKNWSLCTFPFMVSFLVFFAIYIGLNRYRPMWTKVYVIAFSLFFAFKANGILMWLLPIITISSWYLTRFMMRLKRGKVRKIGLALVILSELIPLLYYKYTNFTLEIFHELLRSNFSPEKMLLPVGISFFTFQAISYTVDVYKGRYPKTAELIDYAFYLTFFPLLIAGPITRAEVLLPQVQTPKDNVNENLVYKGLWLIICGLIKKALIADYIAQYNNIVFDAPASQSGFGNLMGVLGFSVQIYFDFSGYSDMAIGMGRCLGFHFNENFSHPYISRSITEFWRRWHISLGSFFRDYVYIPLGGNRRHQSLNILAVWFLTGLWHGASWNFVLWGIYFGFIVMLEKYTLLRFIHRVPRVLLHVYSLLLIVVGWGIFYFDDFTRLGQFSHTLVGGASELHSFITTGAVFDHFWLWIAAIVLSMPLRNGAQWLMRWEVTLQARMLW